MYETETEMYNFGYDSSFIYSYAKDTKKYICMLMVLSGEIPNSAVSNALINTNENIIAVDTYQIEKDRSEILGLDLALPIVPNLNEINTFIIGDYLTKNNALIKDKDDF